MTPRLGFDVFLGLNEPQPLNRVLVNRKFRYCGVLLTIETLAASMGGMPDDHHAVGLTVNREDSLVIDQTIGPHDVKDVH